MVQTDPIRVLLIDDDEDEFVLTRHLFAESRLSRFALEWTPDYDAALDDMARDQHDVYLLDYRMGARDGLELMREALARGCTAPVVILTGHGDGEVDLAAMRAGAADYLVKGRISGELLERALRHAVERKRIERQLARQREEFVAMLTHDIKSPLHVVIGSADMLLEEMKNTANSHEPALIRNLIDSALTINSLVVNYLDFTRIEAVGVSLNKQSVAVGDILTRLYRRYETSAQRRGLTLDLLLANGLPAIEGDPVALERVFVNLLSNAIKFTPNGGRVTVSAKTSDQGMVVTVADTGPGIMPAEIPFIFAKYRRALSTARQDGAGLGLFIAKSLVEAHGGRIDVRSDPGRETRFEVFLPAM
ncbi:MAG TPA: hybrid sensor histidine kinase/response regulator [Candidatus Binatia bacterium]|jgi:signal transduction histidine kinase